MVDIDFVGPLQWRLGVTTHPVTQRALTELLRESAPMSPIIFLDFDDVVAINKHYGGYDVVAPGEKPSDLFDKLFHPPAVALLLRVVEVHKPAVVITTSWLRFFERPGMEQLLQKTGMSAVAGALHEMWEAPANRGMTRLGQIERWLAHHHKGEPYVILDDWSSGTGLSASNHDLEKRVVFCEEGVGLHAGHWHQIEAALTAPSTKFPREESK